MLDPDPHGEAWLELLQQQMKDRQPLQEQHSPTPQQEHASCVSGGGHGEQLDQARLKETLLKRSACRGQQTAAENDWRDLTRSRYRGGVKRHQQNQASSFSVNY